MTVILNLKPEVEARVVAQAQASGMALEEYLLSVVEGVVMSAAQISLSTEEWVAAFRAWAEGHRNSPLLSDYAISREGIYEGRET